MHGLESDGVPDLAQVRCGVRGVKELNPGFVGRAR